MQGISMPRIDLQNLAIKRLRLVEIAGLVISQCQIEYLRNRLHGYSLNVKAAAPRG